MKKRMISLVLTLAVLIPAAFLAAKPAPPRNRCPRIHEAVQRLDAALKEMQEASWDYCGHKDEAMEATRHALEQLRRAEQCKDCGGGDRDHDRDDRH